MKISIETGKFERRRENIIYASLFDDDGNRVISATLDYVLKAIRERDYKVEGVGYIDPQFGKDDV